MYFKSIQPIIDELLLLNLDAQHQVAIEMCSESQNRDKQGIHLFEPTENELHNAWEQAHKDLFPIIWVHYSNVILFKRKAA